MRALPERAESRCATSEEPQLAQLSSIRSALARQPSAPASQAFSRAESASCQLIFADRPGQSARPCSTIVPRTGLPDSCNSRSRIDKTLLSSRNAVDACSRLNGRPRTVSIPSCNSASQSSRRSSSGSRRVSSSRGLTALSFPSRSGARSSRSRRAAPSRRGRPSDSIRLTLPLPPVRPKWYMSRRADSPSGPPSGSKSSAPPALRSLPKLHAVLPSNRSRTSRRRTLLPRPWTMGMCTSRLCAPASTVTTASAAPALAWNLAFACPPTVSAWPAMVPWSALKETEVPSGAGPRGSTTVAVTVHAPPGTAIFGIKHNLFHQFPGVQRFAAPMKSQRHKFNVFRF